jgi:hypothetical protein
LRAFWAGHFQPQRSSAGLKRETKAQEFTASPLGIDDGHKLVQQSIGFAETPTESSWDRLLRVSFAQKSGQEFGTTSRQFGIGQSANYGLWQWQITLAHHFLLTLLTTQAGLGTFTFPFTARRLRLNATAMNRLPVR